MAAFSLTLYYALALFHIQSSIATTTTTTPLFPSDLVNLVGHQAELQSYSQLQPPLSLLPSSFKSNKSLQRQRCSRKSAPLAFVSSPTVSSSSRAVAASYSLASSSRRTARSRQLTTATFFGGSSTPSGSSPRRATVLFGKKYNENKKSQKELLLDLETKLDYEGRISSKQIVEQSVVIADADDENGEEKDEPADELSLVSHRCALITILGMPNMGKSTLLNALLSDDLAIATSRPQTTRHAILGVMTTDYTQLCLTDTPGIIGNPAYRLQEGMMDTVRGAVNSADAYLVVTDVYSGIVTKKNENDDTDNESKDIEEDNGLGIGEEMLEKLRKYKKPVIVCVNKVDLVAEEGEDGSGSSSVYTNTPSQAIQTIAKWRSVLPDAFAILPTCAANGPEDPGVVALRSILLANDPSIDVGHAIRGLGRPVPGMFANNSPMISDSDAREILPEGPPLYHPDFFTDRTDRFCASELIREILFLNLGKELPYCCEVRIDTFDESKRCLDEEGDDEDNNNHQNNNNAGGSSKRKKSMIRIEATILVERESQIGIVVGKGGKKIKDVGIDARKKLQEFFGTKVLLELRVKVDKNWRNDADKLKKYGYMQ